jgi:hypothetical protein
MIRRVYWLVMVLLAFVAVLGGCAKKPGRQNAEVKGKVTIDGKAVTAGNVRFVAEDGEYGAEASLTPEGTYTMSDAPVGLVRITVHTKQYAGNKAPEKEKTDTAKGGGGSMGMVMPTNIGLVYVATPDKYADPKTSNLKYVVEPGSQEHNIELTSK